ncbi:hypothetical protein HY357_04900 [Candidatus Roizmanbacteria bacterium]|nr:hypothetical protein [Candidatus Roizmanbacteria bacterium]
MQEELGTITITDQEYKDLMQHFSELLRQRNLERLNIPLSNLSKLGEEVKKTILVKYKNILSMKDLNGIGAGIEKLIALHTERNQDLLNPPGNFEPIGIELYFRSEAQRKSFECLGLFGIHKGARVILDETGKIHPENVDVISMDWFGHKSVYRWILSRFFGRYIDPSQEGFEMSNFGELNTSYTSFPFSSPDDVIVYPRPNEWNRSNSNVLDTNYLENAIRAKALVASHLNYTYGRNLPVSYSRMGEWQKGNIKA